MLCDWLMCSCRHFSSWVRFSSSVSVLVVVVDVDSVVSVLGDCGNCVVVVVRDELVDGEDEDVRDAHFVSLLDCCVVVLVLLVLESGSSCRYSL